MRNYIFLFCCIFLSCVHGLELNTVYNQGSGVGYKDHYTKIGLYHVFENACYRPFVDLRYLILDDRKLGANLGAGLSYCFNRGNVLSGYTYYDMLESPDDDLFNQISAGVSYLHPVSYCGKSMGNFVGYLNGYFPLKTKESDVNGVDFYGFSGNQMLINQQNRIALTGTNLELGYQSCLWNNMTLYLAGSGYYLKRSDLNTYGGLGKLRVTYNNFLSAEVRVSGDSIYGTNISGVFGVSIPLGPCKIKKLRNKCYCPPLPRPAERFEPILLTKKQETVVAQDNSGNPLNFIFVNNLNGSKGTFEDPFGLLVDAQNASTNGDFIYVFPGDGTTTGMGGGIVMKPSQTLAGSGTDLPVSTSQGTVTVPAFTLENPTLTNGAGNGVDLGLNCTVSGIIVERASENGFFYDKTGDSTLKFFSCIANTSGIFGFGFETTGSSSLKTFINNCRANNNSSRGLNFESLDNSSQINSIKNSIATESNTGFLFTSKNDSTIANSIQKCSSSSNFFGFVLRSFDNSTQTNFSNNFTATDNIRGYTSDSKGSSAQVNSLIDCISNDNSAIGYQIDSEDNSTQVNTLSNCIGNNNNFSFYIISTDNSSQTNSLTDCVGNNNNFGGFDFRILTSNSVQTNSLTDCVANVNTIGFELNSTTPEASSIIFSSCTANSNSDTGFFIKTSTSTLSGGLVDITAIGNTNFSYDIDNTGGTVASSLDDVTEFSISLE